MTDIRPEDVTLDSWRLPGPAAMWRVRAMHWPTEMCVVATNSPELVTAFEALDLLDAMLKIYAQGSR